jgi:hypothetical protein
MAEIRRDRLLEAGFVVRNRRAQPRQPVNRSGQIGRRVVRVRFEQAVKGVLRAFCPGFSVTGPWAFPRFLVPRLGFCDVSGKSARLTGLRENACF